MFVWIVLALILLLPGAGLRTTAGLRPAAKVATVPCLDTSGLEPALPKRCPPASAPPPPVRRDEGPDRRGRHRWALPKPLNLLD